MPEREGMDTYAGGSDFPAAAAHDMRDAEDGNKDPVGHFFSLDRRSHALGHLSAADQAGCRLDGRRARESAQRCAFAHAYFFCAATISIFVSPR